MFSNVCSLLRIKLLLAFFLCIMVSLTAVQPAGAQDDGTQSVAEAARAARAKHAQPDSGPSAPAKHAPFSQVQLLAWQIAGVATPDLIAAVKTNGIAFAPDDTHLAPLKDAQCPADLLAALSTSASHPELATPGDVPQGLIAASQFFNAKNYADARSSLDPLTRQTPSADLFAALGNLQSLLHDAASAQKSFERAVQLDPTFVYAHVRLAGIYYSSENSALATAEARKILQLQPDNAQARKYLALSLSMKLQASNAGAAGSGGGGDVEDLSDLGNNPGVKQEAKDLNNEALEMIDRTQYPGAEANLKKAIAMEPNVALFYYNLGNVYAKWVGHSAAAAEAYRKAKSLAPRNLAVRQNLGHLFCEQHEYQDAVNEFQEMLKMDPSWNIARPCLYKALYAMNRKSEAAQVLAEYREWNQKLGEPDDSDEIDLDKRRQQPDISKGGVHL
jgi:Tfp pilus assembly protein PilF